MDLPQLILFLTALMLVICYSSCRIVCIIHRWKNKHVLFIFIGNILDSLYSKKTRLFYFAKQSSLLGVTYSVYVNVGIRGNTIIL